MSFSTLRRLLNIGYLAALVLAASVVAPRRAGAQETEVLRGQVFGPDKKPIRGARVTVTGLQSKLERSTTTNENGVYTILFSQPEGQYVVSVRAVGFSPDRKRVVNNGEGNLLVTDFTMSTASVQLETVNVTAAGAKKDSAGVGDNERDLLMEGALFSLDPSDLSTFMSNIPGVVYTPGENGQPGSFSVLGANSNENVSTIDGLRTSGDRVPSSAIESMSLSTSSFDASRGGFSGGMLNMRTRAGTNITQGNFSAMLNSPRLAWRDPSYPMPIQSAQNLTGFMSGPIIKNKLFYSAAYMLAHTSAPIQSVLNLRSSLWDQYGLIRDTVDAVTSTLESIGVPLYAPGAPRDQTSLNQTAFLKLNMNPSATTALTINFLGSHGSTGGNGVGVTGYPAMGSESGNSNVTAGITIAKTGTKIFQQINSGINLRTTSGGPYLDLPGGNVLISSQAIDGRSGLTSLQFGGGGTSRSSSRQLDWNMENETSWLTTNSRHRVKFAQSLLVSKNTRSASGNVFGSFSYQSLDALANNQPTSYSRQLSAQTRSASSVSGSVSLGDRWRATNSWSFEYGLRLDMARSGTRPGYNPVVDTVFGRRTDEIPTDIGWSPRFGFNWRQGGAAITGPDVTLMGDYGYSPLSLARGTGGVSRLVVSGGIGAFRSAIRPEEIANLVDATGLPNTIRQLTCVGDATPVPDWAQYAADASTIPDRCLDGTAPVEFSSSNPNVLMYDPSFHAPLSWRANVAISGIEKKGWRMMLNQDISFGFHGTSRVDLNLRRTPMFTLPDEGDRPVYVSTGSIVENTGAVAPGASRISDRFGIVNNTLSDLRSFNTNLSVNLTRVMPFFNRIPVNLTYAWARSRAQFRGGAVGLDPFLKEWGNGTSPTHSFGLQSYFMIKWITVFGSLSLNSGTRYTPVVMGDVNGDGQSGDRAFVFNPATTVDPTVAAEMEGLLAGAPKRARECLRKNLGRMAGLNSCSSGWRLLPNINIGLIDPSKNMAVTDRLRFTVVTQNAFSAVMRVMGAAENNFFIANPMVTPDPTLLYVDGFDPATRRYKYRVNQQFGDTKRGTLANRPLPPFQVGLNAAYSFGGPPRRTFGQNMGLVPVGNAPALTPEQLRAKLRQLSANPIDQVLRMRDSLLLTEQQVADIRQVNEGFLKEFDHTMEPVAEYLADKGKKTDDRELMKRISEARNKVQKTMVDALAKTSSVLTDAQQAKLPTPLRNMLSVKGK